MPISLVISDTKKQAKNVLTLYCHKPAGFQYLAGQYAILTIAPGLQKPLSFSSAPTENYLSFTKRLSDSPFSKALQGLKAGDTITISEPQGSFTLPKETQQIVFIAGGIGITPFRSMLHYVTDKKLSHPITLLYGNKTPEDIIFCQELETLRTLHPQIKICHVLIEPPANWTGEKGLINKDIIQRIIPTYNSRQFYVCGSPSMVTAIFTILTQELQLSPDKIKLEKLAGY